MAVPPDALFLSTIAPYAYTAWVLAALAGYVVLCRALRYRRRDKEHSQRVYRTREDFRRMTAEDAWQIIKYIQGCEFPWTSKKALSFALFKYAHDMFQGNSTDHGAEHMEYQQSQNYYARPNS